MTGAMLLAACTTESPEKAITPVDDYHVTGNCAMTLSEEDLALRAAKHAEPGVTMVEPVSYTHLTLPTISCV